jgi:uncharacterized protein (DUF1330 family)
MKTRSAIVLTALAGIGFGAAAMQGLHAQAKPPVFLVGLIDVSNSEGYSKEYAPKAQAIIKDAGGRLIATGGAGAPVEVTAIEGEPYKGRLIIQQWDSMDKIKAWHTSAAYQENRKVGDKYAKFRFMVLEGRPQ